MISVFGSLCPSAGAAGNLMLTTVVKTAAEDGQHVAIVACCWPLFRMTIQLMVLERSLLYAPCRALTTASITSIARKQATAAHAAPAGLRSSTITPAPAATTLSAFT